MATFQKRVSRDGTTSYRVMVRLKGYPPQSATFPRITDAKRWAEQTQNAIKEGRYFKSSEARKHTLADLIDRYMNDVLPTKPKSEKKQAYQLRWWKEHLGPYSLAEMRPALIAEYRDMLAGEVTYRGMKRGPATVNRYLAVLSHAFTIAEKEWEWLDSNPCRKVRRLTEPRGRVRFLTEDETKRLVKAAEQSDDSRLYPLVVLALSTGARQGELMGLTWRDIDWDRSVAILQDTKNKERRSVPVTGLAREVLEGMNQVRRIDTDLLFADQKGRALFPRKTWERAVEEAKLEDFHFHDLRHTAASYLAMSGATLAEIAEVLGHKTLAMVKRYAHLTEQHTSKVVARMNEQIFGQGN